MFSRGAQEPDELKANVYVYPFELRPQSVKGVLRFWFRAIAPCAIDIYSLTNLKHDDQKGDDKTYDGLKLLESLIFGSQDMRAPFGLTVDWNDKGKPIGHFENDRLENYRRPRFCSTIFNGGQANINYVLYGLYDSSDTENLRMYSYLPVGSTFEITFFMRDESIWSVLHELLRLVSVFSGFGAKTRKGFGEFEITKITDDEGSEELTFSRDSFLDAKRDNLSSDGFKKFICDVANSIKEFAAKYNERGKGPQFILKPTYFNDAPEFPTFVRNIIHVPPNLSYSDEKSLFEGLYKTKRNLKGLYPQAKQTLRKQHNDCVNDLVSALEGTKKEVNVPPTILGLPLQYYNLKSAKRKIKDFNKLRITIYSSLAGLTDDECGRKASPLFVSVHKRKNRYVPVFLILPSQITSKRSDGKAILEKKISLPSASNSNDANPSKGSYQQNKINENFTLTGYEDFEILMKILEKLSSDAKGRSQ
jgi:CRISPR-associated protein Cmr1